jgi:hypothetical protein
MRLGTQELSSSGTINSCVKNEPIAKQLKSVFEDHLRKFVFAVGIPLGTYLGAALTQVEADVREGWDRLVVITDEQSHRSVPAPKGNGYVINVASNRNGVGYGPWTHIDGWSEAVIEYIAEREAAAGSAGA